MRGFDKVTEPNSSVSLQERFLRSKGQPQRVGNDHVVQVDRIDLPDTAIVTLKFMGDAPFADNAAVIAISAPGKIFLPDGATANSLQIWDEASLPRMVAYKVETARQCLRVYNKYRTHHGSGLVTEDKFTGNAGMVVTQTAQNSRRYECSNGPGPFSKADLVFEIGWEAARI
jgi:hypothetical protein